MFCILAYYWLHRVVWTFKSINESSLRKCWLVEKIPIFCFHQCFVLNNAVPVHDTNYLCFIFSFQLLYLQVYHKFQIKKIYTTTLSVKFLFYLVSKHSFVHVSQTNAVHTQ